MRVKIHPLFFVLAFFLVALGQGFAFLWTVLALFLHELAHALVARMRGFAVKNLVLLPFGAMMSVDERFDKGSAVLVGLAGPMANILLALVTLGIWWIAPEAYAYTQAFFAANVTLGLFNLLPAYPLDGSRVVLGLAKHRLKAIKGMQIAGVALSILLFALFILSFFVKFNLSLGVMAIFLFVGAAFSAKEETYFSVLESVRKNYNLGVEQRTVKMCWDAPLIRFFHHVGRAKEVTFFVVDEGGREVAKLKESDLQKIAAHSKLSLPLKDAIKEKQAN